jgi:epoxide hydrolase-like predicted phosphatase
MIRGIIFDCFGVLYVDATHHFYEQHIADYERLRPQLSELNRAYDIGLLTQAALSQEVADLSGLDLAFVEANIQGIHQRNQGLLDYGQSLRTTYKVGMLSNIGIDGMNSFFKVEEREQLFDAVVLSSEVHLVKPDPRIYELMATRLGLLPEECVMIDDVEANIDGAREAGMQGIVYQSNEQTARDIEQLVAAHAR